MYANGGLERGRLIGGKNHFVSKYWYCAGKCKNKFGGGGYTTEVYFTIFLSNFLLTFLISFYFSHFFFLGLRRRGVFRKTFPPEFIIRPTSFS
jgi:hypothetical protein